VSSYLLSIVVYILQNDFKDVLNAKGISKHVLEDEKHGIGYIYKRKIPYKRLLL
jgi:hypothetical protein